MVYIASGLGYEMSVFKRRGEKLSVLLEALSRSTCAFFLVKFSPRSRLARVLGKPVPLTEVDCPPHPAPARLTTAQRDIIWAHDKLERLTGNRLTCLMRSLSARAMLEATGAPAVLVLGVDRGKPAATTKFGAHAWVDVRGQTVVGAREKEGHVAVAAFVLASDTTQALRSIT